MPVHRFRSSLAVLAGVAIFFAVLHTEFLLAWVCLGPFFMSLDGAGLRAAARLGFVTGAVVSMLSFYWMIAGAETFTGSSVWYGVAVFALCTVAFSLYWAVLGLLFARLTRPGAARRFAHPALIAACLWVCAEAALQWLARGMPWFLFRTGNALAENLYAIQPLSWFGVHGATFVVVAVNAAIARCLIRRNWKRLVWPAAAVALYLGIGWAVLPAEPEPTAPGFTLAILSGQIPPSVQWDSASGNQLVSRLLDLNHAAAAQKPDMALWSESAIPWTYRPDDDLVAEITRGSTMTHILGMNTAVSDGVVNNSAYLLGAGAVTHYDKQALLLGVEQPFFGHLIPFFSSNGYAVQPGPNASPLQTPFGAAGIMICNESAVPKAAASAVRRGARYLLNMSNDGWFADTYLVGLHFYNVRLRAVETRRDIAVNSNLGISGLVRASGRIEEARRGDDPFVSIVKVQPREGETLAVRLPWLPVALCGLYIIVSLLLPYKNLQT